VFGDSGLGSAPRQYRESISAEVDDRHLRSTSSERNREGATATATVEHGRPVYLGKRVGQHAPSHELPGGGAQLAVRRNILHEDEPMPGRTLKPVDREDGTRG
jgi:hypothetical protein